MSGTKYKYRPSLTATDIKHILYLAKLDMSVKSVNIIKTLAPFEAKIDNNTIDPAYAAKPRASLLDQLGGIAPEDTTQDNNYIDTNTETLETLDKVSYGKLCYNKYQASTANCSLTEIEAALEHMYVNDLMSPEEETNWEANNTAIQYIDNTEENK